MEREANYAAVGAFVLLVLTMAGLFVYWYSDSREHRDYKRHEIYFDGSVSGLTRGSTVRYLGVDVGRVIALRVDPRDATRVQVIVDIDSSAPISAQTVAELSLQGVTGLLYVDLLGHPGTQQLVPAVPSENFPVIRSVRSNFDVFLQSLPELVGKASIAVDRMSLLLSDRNLRSVTMMMENLNQSTHGLPDTMREVDALVRDLRATSHDVQAVAVGIRGVTDGAAPELKAAIGRVREVADNLASISLRLDKVIADNQADLRGFTRDSLPELDRLLRDSRSAAQEFQLLSRSLRANPSQLIYQPSRSGVEIPR